MTDYKYPPGYVPMTYEEFINVWRDLPFDQATIVTLGRAVEQAVLARLPTESSSENRLNIFWSGPHGHFYTDTLDQGEAILRHLMDGDEYTATRLD